MTEKPIAIKPDLPNAALPTANWSDCYQLRVPARNLTAEEIARMAVGRFPAWVRLLMRIRNAVVGLFGLKPAKPNEAGNAAMIGIFPVVSRSARQIVMGFDDRHLDFRIIIEADSPEKGWQTVRVTTLVNRKILLGRIYIAVITPFHKLIVASMLARVGHQLA